MAQFLEHTADVYGAKFLLRSSHFSAAEGLIKITLPTRKEALAVRYHALHDLVEPNEEAMESVGHCVLRLQMLKVPLQWKIVYRVARAVLDAFNPRTSGKPFSVGEQRSRLSRGPGGLIVMGLLTAMGLFALWDAPAAFRGLFLIGMLLVVAAPHLIEFVVSTVETVPRVETKKLEKLAKEMAREAIKRHLQIVGGGDEGGPVPDSAR